MSSFPLSVQKVHHLHDYSPPAWTTPQAKFQFILDKTSTLVKAEYRVVRQENSSPLPPIFFDGVHLDFVSLRCEGILCDSSQYEISETGLTFFQPPSSDFTLTIENRINPSLNTALEGLYLSRNMLCTQNEPEGFRKITYSIDRPDNMIQFQVTLIADGSLFPILLCNGNLISDGVTQTGKRIAVWEDPFPKPTYLFALVAGDLECTEDSYQTKSGRNVLLQIYTEKGWGSKTTFAMLALKKAMAWDEKTFGLEYDLNRYMIVAVSDFNMGAMENKGLNIFNSKLVLADKSSATDETFESILAVVAHEYFHNYTGNRVTLRNWFNLTLKEGLTVFRDQWFTEDETDPSVKRIKDVTFLKEFQFAEDSSPMSHPILPKSYHEMNNFYTVTVYEKGAEVIRMLSTFLGKSGFQKGLAHYLQTYDGMGVTYEEFISSMEQANQITFSLFRNWYHRKGTPVVRIKEIWSEKEQTFQWGLEENGDPSLEFPVNYALFDPITKSKEEGCISFSGKEFLSQVYPRERKPVLSLFRNFSAPVLMDWMRPLSDWVFLAQEENDGFSRFEARNQVIQTNFTEANQAEGLLLGLFRSALEKQNAVAKDFLGLYLQFPTLPQIAEMLSSVNYGKLFSKRQAICQFLADQLKKEWHQLYEENRTPMPNQDREEMGKRKLKNVALRYLLDTSEDWESLQNLALQQQKTAKTMTEEVYPFRYLQELESPLAEESRELFFEKWKKDPLVLDSWFSAQTLGNSQKTFERVEALLSHPDFLWTNPNKVRSLLGGFARNPLLFHREDGNGYAFLGESLEHLDKINPQTAAFLGKQYQKCARMPDLQKSKAKVVMERLIHKSDLSTSLREVLETILQAWELP